MRILGDLIFAGLGQLKALRVENMASDPGTPSVGQIWYNTTEGVYKGYDGTTINTFASGGNTETLAGEIDAIEAGAGLNSDGTFTAPVGSNYLSGATTLKGATALLDTQIKTVADGLATTDSNVTAVQNEVNAVELGAGLNADGTFTAPTSTNYLGAATSLKQADTLLDSQIKTNADNIATNTSDIATKVSKSGDTMTGNLVMQAGTHVTIADAPVNGTDAVNWNAVQNVMSNQTYRPEADAKDSVSTTLPTGASATIDGHTVVNGDRILFTALTANNNQVYVASGVGTSIVWTAAMDNQRSVATPSDGDTLLVLTGTDYALSAWTYNGTAFVQFNGGTQVMPGVGLSKTGNVLDINLGAGIAQLPTDEVGVDLYTGSGLFLTEDGTTSSTNTNAQLSLNLDGSTLSKSTSGVKVASQGITGTELNASVAGAGLSGGAGAALSIVAGDGITVNADSIQIDTTWADARYINTAGDTLTGALVLAADPTAALEAATKQYVDALAARLDGGTFVYTAGSSATTHVVTHSLGSKYNQVVVYDSTDKVIIPDSITADSTSQLTVTFASAITCKVVVTGIKV
jgi:hypothetical protein